MYIVLISVQSYVFFCVQSKFVPKFLNSHFLSAVAYLVQYCVIHYTYHCPDAYLVYCKGICLGTITRLRQCIILNPFRTKVKDGGGELPAGVLQANETLQECCPTSALGHKVVERCTSWKAGPFYCSRRHSLDTMY